MKYLMWRPYPDNWTVNRKKKKQNKNIVRNIVLIRKITRISKCHGWKSLIVNFILSWYRVYWFCAYVCNTTFWFGVIISASLWSISDPYPNFRFNIVLLYYIVCYIILDWKINYDWSLTYSKHKRVLLVFVQIFSSIRSHCTGMRL